MHGNIPAAFEICVLEIAYGRYEKTLENHD
jgi:hypothetical protein